MGLTTKPFLIESRVLVTRVNIPFSYFPCRVFSTIHQFRDAPMFGRAGVHGEAGGGGAFPGRGAGARESTENGGSFFRIF